MIKELEVGADGHERRPSRGPRPCRGFGRGEDAERDPVSKARRPHHLDRILDRRVAEVGQVSQRNREVGRSDHDGVESRSGEDLVDVLDRVGVLDHGDDADLFVRAGEVGGAAALQPGRAARSEPAAAGRCVSRGGDRGPAGVGADDIGHDDTFGAEVERLADRHRVVRDDPNQGRGPRAAQRHQQVLERLRMNRCVLGVDHDEVVAGGADDLGDDRIGQGQRDAQCDVSGPH